MNPSHRTTKDLFELASLDALGLLTDEERQAFEDAFAAASPLVQAQIRDQQTRMAEIDAVLPRVEPPASLRGRVLAAVQAAIDAGRGVAGRIHVGGRAIPALLPVRGVNPMWRGLAIGCAAAMLVFSVVTYQVFGLHQESDRALASNVMTDVLLKQFGPQFEKALLSPHTRFVSFEAPKGVETDSTAVLLIDQSTRSGQFFCKNLPTTDGNYQLVVIGPDGSVVGNAIATFSYSGSGIARRELNDIDLADGQGLAVMAPLTGSGRVPLLRSTTH
ncbi:MAG: hypothetical protein AB7K52_12400 [Phycisphaerales bacterium]